MVSPFILKIYIVAKHLQKYYIIYKEQIYWNKKLSTGGLNFT
ncbi:hypothetical protein HMPREF9073_02561 [Capnocytophaga sp. oral taxon 326 str. F0382]|nr:hypothetical protein HMPREF9073_02561 [Capnocytophaga sp. oral taxon 326 str. F0382]